MFSRSRISSRERPSPSRRTAIPAWAQIRPRRAERDEQQDGEEGDDPFCCRSLFHNDALSCRRTGRSTWSFAELPTAVRTRISRCVATRSLFRRPVLHLHSASVGAVERKVHCDFRRPARQHRSARRGSPGAAFPRRGSRQFQVPAGWGFRGSRALRVLWGRLAQNWQGRRSNRNADRATASPRLAVRDRPRTRRPDSSRRDSAAIGVHGQSAHQRSPAERRLAEPASRARWRTTPSAAQLHW